MITISHEPIDFAGLTESVRSNAAGAVVLFLGTVREMTAGRQTVALDYEAFPAMARTKLEELLTEAREKWPIVNAAIVHRLGRLELGDISVAVAVSTPHREQAFEAGKYLIDRLKEVVPIWKKENWADGTTEWVHPGVESSNAERVDEPSGDLNKPVETKSLTQRRKDAKEKTKDQTEELWTER